MEAESVGGMTMVQFDDIMKNPTHNLDITLETRVTLWEKSINAYRAAEEEVLDNIESSPHCEEILDVLDALRLLPEQFIHSSMFDIGNLAKLRTDLYKHQTALGIQREARSTMEGGQSETPGNRNDADCDDENTGESSNPLHASQSSSGGTTGSTSSSSARSGDRESCAIGTHDMQQNFREQSVSTSSNGDGSGSGKVQGSGGYASHVQQRVQQLRKDPLLHHSMATLRDVEVDPSRGSRKAAPSLALSTAAVASRGAAPMPGMTGAQVRAAGRANSTLGDEGSITGKLSVTWAGRMDKVDMTQGGLELPGADDVVHASRSRANSTLQVAQGGQGGQGQAPAIVEEVDTSRNRGLAKIKPKWPQFLIDIWFDVIKWNNFGRKQRRVLKLTEYHILNIKEGNKISKLYWYVDIASLWLEDANTLKIVLKGKDAPICYISPMAPSIVQQITTRVQVRLALEKTVFTATHAFETGSSLPEPVFSHDAAVKMIESIQAETSADGVTTDFAHGLISKMKDIDDSVQQKKALEKTDFLNLFSFSEDSIEHTIQKEVQNIIFDHTTDEGNTRKTFVETFDGPKDEKKNRSLSKKKSPSTAPVQKTLLDIRHFVDGLHEYFLSARGLEMTIIMLAWIKEQDGNISNTNECSAATASKTSKKKADVNRMATNAAKYNDDRPSSGNGRDSSSGGNVPRASIRGIRHAQDLSSLSDVHLATLSFISFSVIEEAVFLPLRGSIERLQPSSNGDRDEQVVKRMKHFRKRKQIDWGVPEDFVSPLNWESATFELSGLERASTPSMQLMALARACKAIMAEFKNAVLPELKRKGTRDAYLGADNLVPIFVYVFCRSNLKSPNLYKEIMWTLCHPDQLHGESGYYLTVFESTIEFVEAEPMDVVVPSPLPLNKASLDDDPLNIDALDTFSLDDIARDGSEVSASGSFSERGSEGRSSSIKSRRMTLKERVGVALSLSAEPVLTMHKEFDEDVIEQNEDVHKL